MGSLPQSAKELTDILEEKEWECNYRRNHSAAVSGRCGPKWDDLMCWPATPAGIQAKEPCPTYYFFDLVNTSDYATKQCLDNGTWSTWTNYTGCLSPSSGHTTEPPETFLSIIKTISALGYGVSLTTLAVAFIILASFKRLRCPRNVLHMHLFVSFMLRAGMRLVKDGVFIRGISLSSSDIDQASEAEDGGTWICKLLICVWQYAIISNYSWILMEGLYLHNLIFLALFTDTSAITVYILLGWGLPMGFVVPWAVLRARYEDTLCWTMHYNSNIRLLLDLPIIVSTVVNFFLFINIVRVLLLKLTASICEERRRFRRWAKSTLVLVPLFGAHYAIFYLMKLMPTVEYAWLFIDQLFGSFQGTFVAILYCFLNAEVQGEITKLWVGMEVCGWRTPTHRFLGVNGSRMISRKNRPSTAGESCMTSFISTSAQCEGQNFRRKTVPNINPTNEVTKLEKHPEEP